jgi:hypothetical protein
MKACSDEGCALSSPLPAYGERAMPEACLRHGVRQVLARSIPLLPPRGLLA